MPRRTKEKKETRMGLYIEEAARKHSLSVRGLSSKIGLSVSTLGHIVSGERKADIDVCRKLGEFLKVDPCYLLELAERLPPPMDEEAANRPEWMRNVIYKLSHNTYSKKTIEIVQMILDQSEKE